LGLYSQGKDTFERPVLELDDGNKLDLKEMLQEGEMHQDRRH
jgi:hypothetical protein